jgi:hypothetical protein
MPIATGLLMPDPPPSESAATGCYTGTGHVNTDSPNVAVSFGVGTQEEPTGEADPAGPDPLPGSDMLKNGDLASSGT